MISISNPYMTVALSPEGGSLTSIRNAQTGREYLWQGDPAYWTGQAPNLFPFIIQDLPARCKAGGAVFPALSFERGRSAVTVDFFSQSGYNKCSVYNCAE